MFFSYKTLYRPGRNLNTQYSLYVHGINVDICRTLRYERMYLPLCEVADTPFYIKEDDVGRRVVTTVYTQMKYKSQVQYCCPAISSLINCHIGKVKPNK